MFQVLFMVFTIKNIYISFNYVHILVTYVQFLILYLFQSDYLKPQLTNYSILAQELFCSKTKYYKYMLDFGNKVEISLIHKLYAWAWPCSLASYMNMILNTTTYQKYNFHLYSW